MSTVPNDPYRAWSYDERREARYSDDPDIRNSARQADKDFESSERAYESWRNGGDFSDPDRDGRFH